MTVHFKEIITREDDIVHLTERGLVLLLLGFLGLQRVYAQTEVSFGRPVCDSLSEFSRFLQPDKSYQVTFERIRDGIEANVTLSWGDYGMPPERYQVAGICHWFDGGKSAPRLLITMK